MTGNAILEVSGLNTVFTAKRARRPNDESPASRPAKLTMIPHYSWRHRGANEMAVWLPRTIGKASKHE